MHRSAQLTIYLYIYIYSDKKHLVSILLTHQIPPGTPRLRPKATDIPETLTPPKPETPINLKAPSKSSTQNPKPKTPTLNPKSPRASGRTTSTEFRPRMRASLSRCQFGSSWHSLWPSPEDTQRGYIGFRYIYIYIGIMEITWKLI